MVCGGSAAGHLEGLHNPAFDRGGLFALEHTVTAGPGDLAQPGDTEAAGTARAGAQLVRLDAPAAARYIRVYGRGHLGGWGNYSARMSYAEILAFSTD